MSWELGFLDSVTLTKKMTRWHLALVFGMFAQGLKQDFVNVYTLFHRCLDL